MDCQNSACGLFKSHVCPIALLIACFRSNQLPDLNGFPSMVSSVSSQLAKIGHDCGFMRNPNGFKVRFERPLWHDMDGLID
jgi:hypothetical protein